MSVTPTTRLKVWAEAASFCAFTGCGKHLLETDAAGPDGSLIGEVAHIVSPVSGGPRFDDPLDAALRDQFENLMLLCQPHHKIVDDHPDRYPVAALRAMKDHHRGWAAGLRSPTVVALQIYAEILERWEEQADLSGWHGWISDLFAASIPSMSNERHRQLESLRLWLFALELPGEFPAVRAAFDNFRRVLGDALTVFNQHAELSIGGDTWRTERFYKIREWNPKRYEQLAAEYNYHVALVEDLFLELTRAGNLIFSRVRENFSPTFRVADGLLTVESGPYFSRTDGVINKLHRPVYTAEERSLDLPYPGLQQFRIYRTTRDYSFGRGMGPEDEEGHYE